MGTGIFRPAPRPGAVEWGLSARGSIFSDWWPSPRRCFRLLTLISFLLYSTNGPTIPGKRGAAGPQSTNGLYLKPVLDRIIGVFYLYRPQYRIPLEHMTLIHSRCSPNPSNSGRTARRSSVGGRGRNSRRPAGFPPRRDRRGEPVSRPDRRAPLDRCRAARKGRRCVAHRPAGRLLPCGDRPPAGSPNCPILSRRLRSGVLFPSPDGYVVCPPSRPRLDTAAPRALPTIRGTCARDASGSRLAVGHRKTLGLWAGGRLFPTADRRWLDALHPARNCRPISAMAGSGRRTDLPLRKSPVLAGFCAHVLQGPPTPRGTRASSLNRCVRLHEKAPRASPRRPAGTAFHRLLMDHGAAGAASTPLASLAWSSFRGDSVRTPGDASFASGGCGMECALWRHYFLPLRSPGPKDCRRPLPEPPVARLRTVMLWT